MLAQKVKNPDTDIRWYFPQFTGNSHSLHDVQIFILSIFLSARRDPKKMIYHHFTTAIDTENITIVFNSVKDMIFRRNLENLMLH